MVGKSEVTTLRKNIHWMEIIVWGERKEMPSPSTFHFPFLHKLTEKLVNQLDLNQGAKFCGRQVFAMRK